MSRKLVIATLIVLAILAALGAYLVTRSNQAVAPSTTAPATSESSNGAVAASAVDIRNMAYTPASITVAKGTTVTWTNNDGVAHTVTESDGQTGPDSPSIQPGTAYSFIYKNAGTYHYRCTFHSQMAGTVVVTG